MKTDIQNTDIGIIKNQNLEILKKLNKVYPPEVKLSIKAKKEKDIFLKKICLRIFDTDKVSKEIDFIIKHTNYNKLSPEDKEQVEFTKEFIESEYFSTIKKNVTDPTEYFKNIAFISLMNPNFSLIKYELDKPI